MKDIRLHLSAAALAALPLAPATAQEVFQLDEITVFANLAPTALDSVGSSVTVISADDLQAAGDMQVSDYLNRLPGVSAARQGPFGTATNLRIRGADRRYIAVYVDGVRVDDPSLVQTGTDFGTLMTPDVGRIEVLRGSQSALYGGSAVGGAINITTRAAEEDGITHSYGLEGGSYGTFSGRYGFTQRSERGVLSFNLSHERSEGFSASAEGPGNPDPEPDGLRNTRLSFSARHRVSDTVTLGASAFVQDSRIEYDGIICDLSSSSCDDFLDPNLQYIVGDLDNFENRRQFGGRVFAEIESGKTVHEFELSGNRIARRPNEVTLDDFGVPTGDRQKSSFLGTRLGLGYQGTTEFSPEFTLVYGADYTEERAEYDALPQGSERTRIAGAFAQALWAPSADLDLSASARVENYSSFGTSVTGRAAMAWRPAEGTTVRASASTGFRPPSIDERFGDYGFFVGNPDLEPERSRSVELGVEQNFANGAMIGATAFHLGTDNLVQSTGTSLANLPGRSRTRGIEFEGRMPLSAMFTLQGSYTYIDARAPGGGRLAGVPRHDATVSLDAAFTEQLSGSFGLQHVADRPDEGFPAQSMPDYTLANMNLRYGLNDTTDLTLRVDNIFNTQYQQVAGYGTSGRAAYIGISGRF